MFALPAGAAWPLPLYELALLTATHLDERRITNAELALVTPEPAPLALLGPSGSEAVAALLAERLVRVHVNDRPERFADGRLQLASGVALEADRVVALARLEGHRVEGIPHDRDGFVATRHDGLVEGLDHVYAAGDITRFGVRQGGIAAQQADVVAGTIAARAGADAESPVFEPVLRTLLLTGGQPLYLSAELGGDDPDWEVSTEPLWSPPSKIVGRYLAPFLAARTPAERTTPGYSPAGVGRSYRSRSSAGAPMSRIRGPRLACGHGTRGCPAPRPRPHGSAGSASAGSRLTPRRLITIVAVGVVVLAGILIGVSVAGSSGGGTSSKKCQRRPPATQALFRRHPATGTRAREARPAPVTLVEYGDLQRPICREYAVATLPTIVRDYVRAGKVRLEFRGLAFIGGGLGHGPEGGDRRGRAEQGLEHDRPPLPQPGAGEQRLGDRVRAGERREGDPRARWVTTCLDVRDRRRRRSSRSTRAQARALMGSQIQDADLRGRADRAARSDIRPSRAWTRARSRPRSTSSSPVTASVGVSERRLRSAIGVLALAGLAIASYLTYARYSGVQLYCATRRLRDRPALALRGDRGSPGRGTRSGGLRRDPRNGVRFRPRPPRPSASAWRPWASSSAPTCSSAQLFLIHAICQWCVASDVVVTLLAIATWARFVVAQRGVPVAA